MIIREKKLNKWKKFEVECFICGSFFNISEFDVEKPKKDRYFCSRRCSCKYSSNINRSETNRKISDSHQARGKSEKISKKCKYCEEDFLVGRRNREQSFCSRKCSSRSNSNREETKRKQSESRIRSILRGISNSRGKKMTYEFKGCNIICDSKVEYSCLNWFEKNHSVVSIKRCDFSIPYKDMDGIERRYIPDFRIETENGIFITECKTTLSTINNYLNTKWRDYIGLSEVKKIVLENYCKEKGYISFWYTKNMNRKFYDEL